MRLTYRNCFLAGSMLLALALAGYAQTPSTKPSLHADQFGDLLPPAALARFGSVRLRHADRVSQLAFLSEGQMLASLGDDAAFHVWDTTSGKELFGFVEPGALAAPGDGVTGGERNLYRLMLRRANYREDAASYNNLAFSPDGKFLAGTYSSDAIDLWELATRKKLRRFDLNQGNCYLVGFSPDSRFLVGADTQAQLRVWAVPTGKAIRELSLPGRAISRIAFSPDGSILAGSTANEICLWNTTTWRRIRKFDSFSGQVTALAFAPDGKTLASAAEKTIRLWEMESEEELRSFPASENGVLSLAFAPDGRTLAAGGDDNAVHLWDLAKGTTIREFAGHLHPVTCVAFSPDGKILAAGASSGLIRLWQTATGVAHLPHNHVRKLLSASLDENGQTLSLGSDDGTVSRWDVQRAKELSRSEGPKLQVHAMAITADANVEALADENGSIRLRDTARGRELGQLNGHQGPLTALAFSRTNELLASASLDRTLRVWAVAQRKELWQIRTTKSNDPCQGPGEGCAEALVFSPDGKTLAMVTEGNKVRLWEMATGKERLNFRGNPGGVYPLTFSTDGRTLASGSNDDVLRLWDALTGRPSGGWLTRQRKVSALAFAPAGDLLATGGDDRSVCVWNVATGKELHRFEGHGGPILALTFSPDGTKLVSVSTDYTALLWDIALPVSSAPLVAEQRPVRNLEDIWSDLASDDAMQAYRAGGTLARLPLREVARFLQRRVKPVPSPDRERLRRLVTELDSPRFAEREKASQELKRLGELGEPALRQGLHNPKSPEARRRMEELLQALSKEKPSGEDLRALRTIEVLEIMGTPTAGEALKTLANGAAEARLTREANAALARLAKRSGER